LVKRIWSECRGAYRFISTRNPRLPQGDKRRWRDIVLSEWGDDVLRQIVARATNEKLDIYFCPHGFNQPQRREEFVEVPKMLFADLDAVSARSCRPAPTIAWESSPGRQQAIWLLTGQLDLMAWKKLNRQLTYAIGADRGGWDSTQVLRVPGSRNWKYDGGPAGRVLWMNGEVYSVGDFSNLPEVGRRAADAQPLPDGDIGRMAQRAWRRIGQSVLPSVVELMTSDKPRGHDDRSKPQWGIERALREAGATREECYALVKSEVRWNKFDDDRLWDEIGRVYGDDVTTTKLSRAPHVVPAAKDLSPRKFLYANHYIRGAITTTIGPGGWGKTAMTVVDAIGMASGRNVIGHRTDKPLRVGIINPEDGQDELDRRLRAAMDHYGVTNEDFGGRLFVDAPREDLIVMRRTRNNVEIIVPVVNELTAYIMDNRLDALIVDPWVAFYELNENDNAQMHSAASLIQRIAERTECAIDANQHTRKTDSEELTANDGRGASSTNFKFRDTRVMNRMSPQDSAELGVDGTERVLHVYFGGPTEKVNRRKSSDRYWYHLISHEMTSSTGEVQSIQVVEAWAWPSTVSLSTENLRRIAAVINAGQLSMSPTSASWVGDAVAGVMRCSSAAQTKQIINLIKPRLTTEELWIGRNRRKVLRMHVNGGRVIPVDFSRARA
jgi:hypothetical protein